MYGGLAAIRSKRRPASGANQLPCNNETFVSCSRPILRLAISSASLDASTAATVAAGRSDAIATAMAPLPVPRSATRAGWLSIYMSQRALDHQLGFRSRNQHRRADFQQQRPEFLLLADVCNRLALRAPLDQLLKRPAGVGGQLALRVRRENSSVTSRLRTPAAARRRAARMEKTRDNSIVAVCRASETVCEDLSGGHGG